MRQPRRWRPLSSLVTQLVRWVAGVRQRWVRRGQQSIVSPSDATAQPPTSSQPTTQPPEHWLAQAQGSGPPADWLARVQQGAPHLLDAMARGAAFGLPPRSARPPAASAAPATVIEDTAPSPHRADADPAADSTLPSTRQQLPAHVPSVETPGSRVVMTQPPEPIDRPRVARHRASRLDVAPASPVKGLPLAETAPTPFQGRQGRGPTAPVLVASQPRRPVGPVDTPTPAPRALRPAQPPTAPMTTPRPWPSITDEGQQARKLVAPSVDDASISTAYRTGHGRQLDPDTRPSVTPRQWATGVPPPAWPEATTVSEVRPADVPSPQPMAKTSAAPWADYDAETQGRWPTLPLDDPSTAEDWEMSRRAWERRQRLDREQAGRWSIE